MADWPAHGSTPWDTNLKAYVDEKDAAAIAAADAAQATADETEANLMALGPAFEAVSDMAAAASASAAVAETRSSTLQTAVALPSHVVTAPRYNPYDAEHNVYNFKQSNTKRLRAGLGKSGSGQVSEHIVVGDSMSAGCVFGAAAPYIFDRAHAWPRMMAKALGTETGSGLCRVNDNLLGSPQNWVLNGTWNLTAKFYAVTTVPGDTAVFTVPDGVSGTAFTVTWYDPGTGGSTYPWTASINGAASGAGFRTTDSDLASANWRITTLIPTIALKSGDTITLTAGANGLYLVGGEVHDPANGGLRVHNLAQSGSRAYSTANGQTDRWASLGANGLGTILNAPLWQKRTVTDAVLNAASPTLTSATAAFTIDDVGKVVRISANNTALLTNATSVYIAAFVSATQVTLSSNALASATGITVDISQAPDCIHIELGGNDLSNGVSSANINAAITAIRNFFPNSDCVLYASLSPATSLIAQGTYDAWVSSMYDLADALDVPLFDMRARYGTWTEITAKYMAGDATAHVRPEVFADWGANVAAVMGAPYGNKNTNPAAGLPVPATWRSITTGANLTLDATKRHRLMWLGAAGTSAITLSNASEAVDIDIDIFQGATPSTLTWSSSVRWVGNAPPVFLPNTYTHLRFRLDLSTGYYIEQPRTEGIYATASVAANLTGRPRRVLLTSSATAAATAAKTATLAGYTLTPGDQIDVVLTNGNTATNPTLNINGTGALPIYLFTLQNTAPTNLLFGANSALSLVYNGTYYSLVSAISGSMPSGLLSGVSGVVNLSAYTTGEVALRLALTGNVTGVTLPTLPAGASLRFLLEIVQDGVGGRTFVFTAGTVRFSGDTAPVLTTTANSVSLLSVIWTGQSWWVSLLGTGSTALKP